MVRPTTDADRRIGRRQIAAGFVATVAGSAGLTALRVGASPLELAAAVLFGGLVGTGLVWYGLRLLAQAGRPR